MPARDPHPQPLSLCAGRGEPPDWLQGEPCRNRADAAPTFPGSTPLALRTGRGAGGEGPPLISPLIRVVSPAPRLPHRQAWRVSRMCAPATAHRLLVRREHGSPDLLAAASRPAGSFPVGGGTHTLGAVTCTGSTYAGNTSGDPAVAVTCTGVGDRSGCTTRVAWATGGRVRIGAGRALTPARGLRVGWQGRKGVRTRRPPRRQPGDPGRHAGRPGPYSRVVRILAARR